METAGTNNCSKELKYPELPSPECVVDTNADEIIVAILIVLLVLVTFYRLLHVWAYTLNFSEVQTGFNNENLIFMMDCLRPISRDPKAGT